MAILLSPWLVHGSTVEALFLCRYDLANDVWTLLGAQLFTDKRLNIFNAGDTVWVFQKYMIKIFEFATEDFVEQYAEGHPAYIDGFGTCLVISTETFNT